MSRSFFFMKSGMLSKSAHIAASMAALVASIYDRSKQAALKEDFATLGRLLAE